MVKFSRTNRGFLGAKSVFLQTNSEFLRANNEFLRTSSERYLLLCPLIIFTISIFFAREPKSYAFLRFFLGKTLSISEPGIWNSEWKRWAGKLVSGNHEFPQENSGWREMVASPMLAMFSGSPTGSLNSLFPLIIFFAGSLACFTTYCYNSLFFPDRYWIPKFYSKKITVSSHYLLRSKTSLIQKTLENMLSPHFV